MEDDSFNSADTDQPSMPPNDAPPSEVVYPARPAVSAPPVINPVLYPDSSMSRGSAAGDLFIAVSLLLCIIASPLTVWVVGYAEEQFPAYGILWSNVFIGICTIAVVGGILLLRRQSPATIGLGRFRNSTFVGAIVAPIGCFAVMIGTGLLYTAFIQLFGDSGLEAALHDKEMLVDVIPPFSIATMLLFGVLTGFHEELLFRGLLLSRFNAIVRNRALAVVICAVLFGLMHGYQGPMGMLQTAAIGLMLGTIATMTRSLWPAIIGHAIFNSIQLAALPFAKEALDAAQQHLTTMPVR